MTTRYQMVASQLAGAALCGAVALAAMLLPQAGLTLWLPLLVVAVLSALALAWWVGGRLDAPRQSLQREFDALQAQWSALSEQARRSAQAATDAAHALAGMTEQVGSSVQQQADSTREAAATIQQMTVSINHVTNSSGKASRMAREAGEIASQRVLEVMQSSEAMRAVADKVQATSHRIEALTSQVEKIGNIVGVIVDVANQTNLLALNAAIEAARAGEFGRGFAVVADEVRKLAERSAVSAQEITTMIQTIQQEAGSVVESMQQSLESVLQVSEGAAQSAESMQGIQDSSQTVVGSIETINGSLREQRMASIELAQKVAATAQLAESNIEVVTQLRQTSDDLLQLAQGLGRNLAHVPQAVPA
ncbi:MULTISPECIES: methyl-accepting chemotaxis protein [unclassified Paludibacterium]|uniref:methyl-accepting chemotaxis protein n=1 Tax=unclassified Paludibacterium TaxID=2618429 RepID=UPI001C05658A|nr:methyl-accepting chemotaxis protein [Paludibacterium sp. B53371]